MDMKSLKQIAQDPDTIIVDVRSAPEFEDGHIPQALHMPLEAIPSQYKSIEGIGSKHIIFYCRSGNRSGMAVKYLQDQGIGNIYNGGGLSDVLTLLN